jgi:enoyl-CoA hydratase/carnithine racemase
VTVRIARPSKKNALTLAMWTELGRLCGVLANQPDIRCVILGGTGGSFSAGADIAEFDSLRATAELAQAYEVEVDRCLDAIVAMPQPTVAAINGACVGGGFAIAQSCDFRVANAMAYFSVSAAKVGLVYGISKCQRLVSLVGLTHAKWILLTGKRFDCTEAKALGFIDEIVEGEVLEGASAFARELSTSAPLSSAGMKVILHAIALGEVDRRRVDLERAIRLADESADHREAVAAFAEKRPPRFRGL